MKKRTSRQILSGIMFFLLVGVLNIVSAGASDISGAASVVVPSQINEKETIQTSSGPDRKKIQIAVVAKRGKEKAIKKWQPTADYLTQNIPGYKFAVKPYDWDEIRWAVANGIPDFVLTNPGMYVEFEALHDVRRIATLKNLRLGKPYTSFGVVFFRRTDRSDILTSKDIRGKRLAAVNETAWGGWQVGWRQLLEMGIDPYKDLSDLSFAGSHDNVVLAVRDKKVDIGSVRTDTLERMASEGRIDLADFTPILLNWEYGESFPFWLSTKLYPEWPFATASHTAM
jgi:ABC-type phosphate/phosphonate transport system substrate-binding protein